MTNPCLQWLELEELKAPTSSHLVPCAEPRREKASRKSSFESSDLFIYERYTSDRVFVIEELLHDLELLSPMNPTIYKLKEKVIKKTLLFTNIWRSPRKQKDKLYTIIVPLAQLISTWLVCTLEMPEHLGIIAVQGVILDFLVSHMPINETSLYDFAQHQPRRKHPPFTFIPICHRNENINIFTLTDAVSSKREDGFNNCHAMAAEDRNLRTKIPGLKVWVWMLFSTVVLVMKKSTNESNYLLRCKVIEMVRICFIAKTKIYGIWHVSCAT